MFEYLEASLWLAQEHVCISYLLGGLVADEASLEWGPVPRAKKKQRICTK